MVWEEERGKRTYFVIEEPVAKTIERDTASFAYAKINRFALLAVLWCGPKHMFVVDGERVDIPYWFGDGGRYGVKGGKGIEVYLVV